MTESPKAIYERLNALGGGLDTFQQQYQVFNGNGQSDFNASAHALTSGTIALHLGEPVATLYGEGREARTRISTLFSEGRLLNEGEMRDGLRDVFNNRVGNEIAKYASENNLGELALAHLAGDALARGLLIVNEFRDPRILDPSAGTILGN